MVLLFLLFLTEGRRKLQNERLHNLLDLRFFTAAKMSIVVFWNFRIEDYSIESFIFPSLKGQVSQLDVFLVLI
jgi:hypothetical protein